MNSARTAVARNRPAARLVRIALLSAGTCALAAAALAAAPAPEELEHRYPKGSIKTSADAQRALADAAAADQGLDERFASERARCARVFLATQCLDRARRVHSQGHAQVHRIEVEAHDLQREQAAAERRARQESDQARQHADEARRPDPSHKPGVAPKTGGADAGSAHQQAQAMASRERFEKRNAEHQRDQAKSAEIQIRKSPENARKYQDKQERAKAYAADRAREREDNEKNRAERERERKKKFEDPSADPAPVPAPASK